MFKILTETAWTAAEAAGTLPLAGVDARDGFVHLSAGAQVAGTLAHHFTEPERLVLLAFDAASLGAALKWEPSRDGALFPHLYGPLDLRAATHVWRLARGPDGVFVLPDGVA